MTSEIEIADVKTLEELKNKLSYELKTSPDFLYISGTGLNNTNNLVTAKFVKYEYDKKLNIKTELEKLQENTRIVIDVFDYVKKMEKIPDISPGSDITKFIEWDDKDTPVFIPLYLYKFYNYENDDWEADTAMYLTGSLQPIIKYYTNNNANTIANRFKTLELNRIKWLVDYKRNIEISQISELGDQSGIKFTQEILSQTVTITIDTSKQETEYFNLDVMFNNLILNDLFKLAIYKDLAKIHKDLEHTVNISYNTHNSIHIYPNIDSDYSDPEIRVYIDDNNNIKITTINKETKDKIAQIVCELFNLRPELIHNSGEVSNITASINYENIYINKYILLDIILNKEILTDEDQKETVSKFSTNEKIFTEKMFSSRIFFKTQLNQTIVANVKQICNTVTSKKVKHTFKDCNKTLQVNIAKCKNDSSLSQFLYYFNKLITIVYDINKDSIIQSYEDTGIDINIITDDSQLTLSANDVPCKLEKGSDEKQFFATLYPYLFKPEIITNSQHKDDFRTIEILKGTDYLSSCAKKPIVISEKEALQIINENGGIIPECLMKYPENTIEMPLRSDIPSNKSRLIYPMWFYCRNKEDMEKSGDLENASARTEKLTNSTRIALMPKNTITPTPGIDMETNKVTQLNLPCCYLPSKTGTTASKRSTAANIVNPKIDSTGSRKIPITTNTGNSMVKYEAIGDLPPLILKLFEDASQNSEQAKSKFNRLGVVNYGNSSTLSRFAVRDSFFKCLLNATENNSKEEDIRKSLELYIPIAKQSLPDMTVDEIYAKYFSEKATEYMDPFYFLQMFEALFNVRIIVLRRDTIDRNQQITNVVPYYRHLLYKNEYESVSQSTSLKRKTVLIYEHRGGAPTPFYSCELIIMKNGSEIIKKFVTDQDFIQNIKHMTYYCFNCYTLKNKLEKVVRRNISEIYRWNDIIQFEKQYIDEYGKTRQLLGKLRSRSHDQFMFIVNVSPIEPLPLVCVSDTKLNLTAAIPHLDFYFLYIQIDNEIQSIIPTDEVNSSYITWSDDLIEGELGLVKFSIESTAAPSLSHEKSELDNYKLYKKTALSLKSLFIWLYSKFITEATSNEKTMDNFLKLNTTIDVNCYYDNPTEFLSFEKNPGYFIDNKLKLETDNIRKRLVYYLNIASKNWEKIINYKDNHIIEGYFDNIENYNKHDDQIITKVLSDKYNTNSNIKSLQIMEWLEKITNKPLTESFEISMLYGIKLAEAIKILEYNLSCSGNIPLNSQAVEYVDLERDDKSSTYTKIENNIKIYNTFINSNKIPNKDNYILDWNKFKTETYIRKNIKNIYNSIYAIQRFFKGIPSFTNESIKDKILYNNKHKIHKEFQKYNSNTYFHRNSSNSISLCYNTTNIDNAIKCGNSWNTKGMVDVKNLNNSKTSLTKQQPIKCLFPVNKNTYITKQGEYKHQQNKDSVLSTEHLITAFKPPLSLSETKYDSDEDNDSVDTVFDEFIDLQDEEKASENDKDKTVKIVFIHNSPDISVVMN